MKSPNLTFLLTVACLGAGYAQGADSQAEAKLAYERGEYQGAQEKLLVAANQGDAQAQELLGFMHAFGSQMYPGVTRDLKAATQWFDLAARNGRPGEPPVQRVAEATMLPSRSAFIACSAPSCG
jgi:hypothetical protein